MAWKQLRGPDLLSSLAAAPLASIVLLSLALGCKTAVPATDPEDPFSSTSLALFENGLRPSNQRDWSPDLAVLPYAEFDGDLVTIHNIRNCVYVSDEDYVVNHYEKTFDQRDVETVDFIVVPFKEVPSLAHTMISFGFSNGDYLGVSVEARLEQGETYSPMLGSLRQYELMYVVADERDLIVRRTKHRDVDVYLYRTIATPEQSGILFVDVMQRVNKLYHQPEFYDTLTNNCTTNIARHVNRMRPGRLPYDLRILLPGLSDQLAYETGLLRREGTFAQTRKRAHINRLANRHAESGDFSAQIRR
ncbi:MAG: DUF4105 domain-containing protein [Pirellulaceae bacterium]